MSKVTEYVNIVYGSLSHINHNKQNTLFIPKVNSFGDETLYYLYPFVLMAAKGDPDTLILSEAKLQPN